ncbi:hypothetical protein [Pacificibacter marinus]|uniref:hypothetical protein n=1 Tax=Pacificibacter marinus TaxID=658057 RepID=UPI001C07C060|nr:hypothetical protein [Pacificibacter marinus]MBU2867469.1 hypothetical protein [Pacificibacter marinus]
MSKFLILLLSSVAFFATAATAQEIDCEDEANKDDAACIGLPDADDVQNFLPGVAPILGGGGIFASALLGNNTTSTTATTATTSTN